MLCTMRVICARRHAVLLLAQFVLVHCEMGVPCVHQLGSTYGASSSVAHSPPNGPHPVITRTLPPQPQLGGRPPYSHFFRNVSYIGRSVPCTHREKLCFRYNMLYDTSGCQELDSYNVSDGKKVSNGNGHLGSNTSTPIHVEQPEENGCCRIPDLRFPFRRSHFFQNPNKDIQGFEMDDLLFRKLEPIPSFNCSSEQAHCFSVGRVWVAEGQGCFLLLEKGPCAEEHVVALDAQAAREGRAEATCAHVRGGCPQGHVRMEFDGKCHKEDISIIVNGIILKNQFAKFIFAPRDGNFYFRPFRKTPMVLDRYTCAVHVQLLMIPPSTAPPPPLKPFCGGDDKGECRHEVKDSPSKPAL